jgi:uncharacterized membrane protein
MPPDREDQLPGILRAHGTSVPPPPASLNEAAALLPDHVSQNIEAIKTLHIRADESLSRYQRPIETVSSLLGRPAFFYGIVLFVTMWVLINVCAPLFAVHPSTPPPYSWLQGLVGLGALLTTTVVLITQTRQGKLAEQRAQLDLQGKPAGRAKKPPNSLP